MSCRAAGSRQYSASNPLAPRTKDVTGGPQTSLLGYLHRLAAPAEALGLPDEELLRRFIQKRDESAFTALVRRHGPMVLAACRRLLARGHDVEDAFQATFLVLARRAAAVARPERLGPWLYGVAFRVARQARRRSDRDAELPSPEAIAGPTDDPLRRELESILDEELAALPERYREPLVLCCLQGLSREEAAARLKVSAGAVKGLLERGRDRLRERLERRGLSGCVMPPVLAAAAVPEPLAAAAVGVVSGSSASEAVTALAQGVLSMNVMKWQAWLSLAAVVLLCGAGVSLAMQGGRPQPRTLAARAAKEAKEKDDKPEPKKKGDGELDVKGRVDALVWDHDGKRLFVAGNDGVIRLWEPASGEVATLEGHKKAVSALALTRDRQRKAVLASAGKDNVVILWDVGTRKFLATIETKSSMVSLALPPNGDVLFGSGGTNEIFRWEVPTGKALATFRLAEMKAAVRSLAVSPDGKSILAGAFVALNTGEHWDVFPHLDALTGKELRGTVNKGGDLKTLPKASKHRSPVAYTSDGKFSGGVSSFDNVFTTEGDISRLHGKVGGDVTGLALLPDGKTVVTVGRDGSVHFIQGTKEKGVAKRLAEVKDQGEILSLALSPDGKRVAWATAEGKVKAADVAKLLKDYAVAEEK